MRKLMKHGKSLWNFGLGMGRKADEDELFAASNELAYKLLLAFFPFLVFLISLLSFFTAEDSRLVLLLYETLPDDISALVARFLEESQLVRSRGLLSAGLLVSIYSSSNGFRAIIRSVNKAYGQKDTRHWLKQTVLCISLMLLFTFSLIVMLVLWMFGDAFVGLIRSVVPLSDFIYSVMQWGAMAISWGVLTLTAMIIYRLALVPLKNGARGSFKSFFPGAGLAVAASLIASEVFGFVIARFSNFSVLYGSIAGVFILIIWLNLIAFILLLGNTFNALRKMNKESKE